MSVDALIITALKAELDAVLALGPDGERGWQQDRDPGGFRYHTRQMPRASGGAPLRLAAAWSGQMGESAAAVRATQLIAHLDPGCLGLLGMLPPWAFRKNGEARSGGGVLGSSRLPTPTRGTR